MATKFKSIDVRHLQDNPFKLIGDDWMLITGGTKDAFNTMTASWGGLGILWGKPVCFVFVRPTRHTFQFMEDGTFFGLSFFGEEHRSILDFCGANSGRDVDKIKRTGLIPVANDHGVYFEQARLVMQCRKLHRQDIDPAGFVAAEIDKNYPGKDYHRMYVGEIIAMLTRE